MPPRKNEGILKNQRINLRLVLIALVLGVLTLSILAFISPVSQGGQETTPSPTGMSAQETGTPETEENLTQTAEVEALPPTPEEIGYTDGIIFMSTLLILILLLGTLREALRRKKR